MTNSGIAGASVPQAQIIVTQSKDMIIASKAKGTALNATIFIKEN